MSACACLCVLVCGRECVFTCVDSSIAACVCCPVLAEVVVVMLWLLLLWMDSLDSAAPSRPNPTRDKHTNEWSETDCELAVNVSVGVQSKTLCFAMQIHASYVEQTFNTSKLHLNVCMVTSQRSRLIQSTRKKMFSVYLIKIHYCNKFK